MQPTRLCAGVLCMSVHPPAQTAGIRNRDFSLQTASALHKRFAYHYSAMALHAGQRRKMQQQLMSSGCGKNGRSSWPRPMPSALRKPPGQSESLSIFVRMLCNIHVASLHPKSGLGLTLVLHPICTASGATAWRIWHMIYRVISSKHMIQFRLLSMPLELLTAAGLPCPAFQYEIA